MPPILVLSSAKRIATQMLVIEKLNGRKDFILRGFPSWQILVPRTPRGRPLNILFDRLGDVPL